MDVNAGIEGSRPAFIAVRASEITAAAMSRAYRFWNNARIGVSFAWTRNTRNSTYLTRTGGVGSKSNILAAADYPAQSIGHQHTIDVYDLFLEASWQPVGPLVLAHELGHTLGIRHNEETEKVHKLWDGKGETIMNAATSRSANLINAIPERDAEGARILYNEMNPIITDGRIIAVMTPPLGPVSKPPDFLPRKCKWTVFGVCIYYAFEE